MATYTKKLKTAEIHLLIDSHAMPSISDTADSPIASVALASFDKGEDMVIFRNSVSGQTTTSYVAYQGVQYIKVNEAETEVEKNDPYGCE